jgi:transposase
MSKVSEIQLGEILALRKAGNTIRQIEGKMNLPRSTISYSLKKYEKLGSLAHKRGNGRRSSLSGEIVETIEKNIKLNSRLSLRKMEKILKKENAKGVSRMSIKRYLNSVNIFSYAPISKPLLRPQHAFCSKKWCFLFKTWQYYLSKLWN